MHIVKNVRLTNLQFELLNYMKANNWKVTLQDYFDATNKSDPLGYYAASLRELQRNGIITAMRDVVHDTVCITNYGLQQLGW